VRRLIAAKMVWISRSFLYAFLMLVANSVSVNTSLSAKLNDVSSKLVTLKS
ncbi:hypothetical protein PF008_g29629, partial [Phytophthora fragariae]